MNTDANCASTTVKKNIYRGSLKPLCDRVLAATAFVLLLPLLLGLVILVRLRLGSPVLFRQQRPGKNGTPFTLYKFRTMTDATDKTGELLPDNQRLTHFGKWLRSTSLDELPELLNILRGDMSFVGPRPLLMEYLDRYTPEQMRRHEVRPGLTGWAQVNGRNAISWENKFSLDLWYVNHVGFWLDLKILFLTAWKVLSREGISAASHSTAPIFLGTEPVFVIGAGGHAKVVLATLKESGVTVDGIYDDNPALHGTMILGIPVVGPISNLLDGVARRGIIAVDDNDMRKSLASCIEATWLTAVHPSAFVHESVTLGRGTVIFAGAVIQPDAHIGEHVIVNTAATVDHDSTLKNFVSIGPGSHIAGNVHVDEGSCLGIGSSVLPQLTIGKGAVIGGGATVIRNVAAATIAAGCPAKAIRIREGTPLCWPAISIQVSKERVARNVEKTSSWPVFDAEQRAAVERVLCSGNVNYWTGHEGRSFETEYAASLGVKHAIAVANGTVALELALLTLGVGPGDEVIVPSRTFIASASAAVMQGATPVIADIDEDSQNLTVDTIAAVMTSRTKAIIAVHLAGWPCDMDPIMEFARKHGLFVIEDCAQAHGAFYKGRPVGSIGHINAFSFCQDKIISTGGEGGLVVTDDDSLWQRAWSFKDHGKSWDAVYNRKHTGSFRFLHESFGTNWRMTEMQAAIGRLQLQRLPSWVERRRENANQIMEGLAGIEGLRFSKPLDRFHHSYYRLYGFIDPTFLHPEFTRDRIVAELTNRGISSGCGSCGEIYLEKAFEAFRPPFPLSVAHQLHETSLVFLVHPTLTEEDVARTIAVTRNVFSEALMKIDSCNHLQIS